MIFISVKLIGLVLSLFSIWFDYSNQKFHIFALKKKKNQVLVEQVATAQTQFILHSMLHLFHHAQVKDGDIERHALVIEMAFKGLKCSLSIAWTPAWVTLQLLRVMMIIWLKTI